MYYNEHTFDWYQKKLGQATTRYAREFKEDRHSMDKSTINRRIDIPTIYYQFKHPKLLHSYDPSNNNDETNVHQTEE